MQIELCTAHQHTQYVNFVGICLGDVTGSKALSLFNLHDNVLAPFDGRNGKLTVPILLQQATNDNHVLNPEQSSFCSSAATSCTLSVIQARHNIWFHADATRNAALGAVDAFFAAHTALVPQGPAPRPACTWYRWWNCHRMAI